MCFVRLHALPCSLLFFFFRDVCQLFLSPRSQKKKNDNNVAKLISFFFFFVSLTSCRSASTFVFTFYTTFFLCGFFFSSTLVTLLFTTMGFRSFAWNDDDVSLFPPFFLRHLFFFFRLLLHFFFFLLLLFTNLFFFFFEFDVSHFVTPSTLHPPSFLCVQVFTLRHLYLRSFNRKGKKRGWEKWTRSKPTVTVQKGNMEEVCQGLHLYNQEKENELSTRGV